MSEKKTKKGLNKHNDLSQNLSEFLTDSMKLDEAMNKILNEREITISYKLKKCK